MKIVHIINSLGQGGSENTLFKLCKYDSLNKHFVISLTGTGAYYYLIKNLGVKVYCLNLNFFSIYNFFYLIKLLRNIKPDILQTWLFHSDLIGGLAGWFAGIRNIIWNIRSSNLELGKAKLTTILIIKILSKLSYFIPAKIIIASKKAKNVYKDEKYDTKKLKFIPNGYDLSILKPNQLERLKFRKKIKVNLKTPVIGCIARYAPEKDHLNLLYALSEIRLKNINFYCILAGSNINKNQELIYKIKKLKLNNNIRLLKSQKNISEIMNGIDVHVLSSSYGEAFPNIVSEAMAIGTPCVVTNVADAGCIVNKTGWVVPIKNPNKLAIAIETVLSEIGTKDWIIRCNSSRERIKINYSINKMIKAYNIEWNKVYNKNV